MGELNKVIDAVTFLKDKKEYKRILSEIFEKYKRLGKFSGIIELKNLTEEERRILAPLNHKYFNAKEAKVSVKKFVDYFCNGKFEGLDFGKVLAIYFNDELITYREQKEDKQRKKEEFFNTLLMINEDTKGEEWLQYALENKICGYSMVSRNYEAYINENRLESFKSMLNNVIKGINTLTFNVDALESLPIFSSKVAKDPHYFDTDTLTGKILLYGICYHLKREYPGDAEETAEVLYYSGLIKDTVSNFTSTFGLRAYHGDNEFGFIYDFTKFGEPLLLTLGNLSKIDRIVCNKNKLFIFENPSLFSEVVKITAALKPSIICTSGQLKLASLVLLDKLVDEVNEIYYSGDFDPEGISIANKLKIRYGDKLKLWRFTTDDYLRIVSDKVISEVSMSKLNSIKSNELADLIESIREKKLAGYQELLVEDYIRDIKAIV